MRKILPARTTILIFSVFVVLLLGVVMVPLAKADSVTATIPVGQLPNDILAYGALYVPNSGPPYDTVSVINPTTHAVSTMVLRTSPITGSNILGPYGAVDTSPDGSCIPLPTVQEFEGIGNCVLISEQQAHELAALFPGYQSDSGVPGSPSYMACNFDCVDVYITEPYQDRVVDCFVFDGLFCSYTIPLPTGSFPVFLTFDRANGNVYVSDEHSHSVSVIRGDSVIGNIAVDGLPEGVVADTLNGLLYVSINNTNLVDVIKLTATSGEVIQKIFLPKGESPVGIAFDGRNGHLYVASQPDAVNIINGATNTVIQTLTGFDNPITATWDSANGKVYVVNKGVLGKIGDVSEITPG